MKYAVSTISFLLILVLIAGCGIEKSTDPQDGDRTKPPAGNRTDHVVELGFGQSAEIASENLTVTFESVEEDSRCPADAYCFWEGQAIIGLRVVAEPNDTHQVDVTLHGGCPSGCSAYIPPLDTLGYRFELLGLDPYPMSTTPTPFEDYIATLAIFPFSPIDSADGVAMISNQHPASIQHFSFDIDSVWIDDDVLSMMMSYGCGCVEPAFEMYMSPAGFYTESLPYQANLYLRHNDPCEMGCSQVWSFDVRPIAHLYEIQYGQIDCIALNVYDFIHPDKPATKTTVIYHPTEATPTSWCGP